MSKALNIVAFIWRRRTLWATVFFVIVVGFLDENSIINLYSQYTKNSELRAEIEKYEKKYDASAKRLKDLSTSQEAVVEVARVDLHMKSNDEDIYIVEEEK